MRRIKFDPRDYQSWTRDQQKWWDDWTARARAARATLLASNRLPRPFQSNIWSELKTWLLDNFFNGKCAYCEINVSGGFFGDGEHFRPKSSVRVHKNGKLTAVVRSGRSSKAHGGYYWLAYDPTNLLPSCDKCNNRKSDQFPVKAIHVFDPPAPGIDLDAQEQPLLVHPCRDDPGQHIRFGVVGTVAALDKKGECTIEVFGLNRDGLSELRKARQEEALTQWVVALMNHAMHGIPIDVTMGPFMGEKAPFSMAVNDYLKIKKEPLEKELEKLWPRAAS
jgi:hypothetical protein